MASSRSSAILKDRLTIKNITLANRVVAAPLVTDSGDNSGVPTGKTLEIYRGYARCRAGLVVAEQHTVHPWGRGSLCQPRLYDDASAQSLAPMTRPFRDAGVPVVAQLNFAARATEEALFDEPDYELVSPSGLPTPRKSPVSVAARPLDGGRDTGHRAVLCRRLHLRHRRQRQGHRLLRPYSKATREAVQPYGLPVDCTGGIRTPETAEKLLQAGVCDLVGIGRPLLADKDFLSVWTL